MTHLFVNALAASAGGGLTYVRNLLPLLRERRDLQSTVLLSSSLRREFQGSTNLNLLEWPDHGAGNRFVGEQRFLPEMIRQSGADVLLSTGNFALWRSPVPQILLSRNALYLSGDFYHDLRSRGDMSLWLETRMKGALAKRSIREAQCTIAPSRAFADDLAKWSGVDVMYLHHGFDHKTFFRSGVALPEDAQKKLEQTGDSCKILFVSHYNYYRNFETLFRAIPILKQRFTQRRVTLFLTCELDACGKRGEYSPRQAFLLAQGLGIMDSIVQLGAIPYGALHHLYRKCDLYVTPAYAESFAHPLVEAMASGVPVVASDIPVHREICDNAAVYFHRFSADQLAGKVMEVCNSPGLAARQRQIGLERARHFNWEGHLDSLLEHAMRLRKGECAA